MRVDPRASLTVQLIQEAELGPGRFAPFGPARRTDAPESSAAPACRCESPEGFSPVHPKPAAGPADVYTCDGRLARPCLAVSETPPIEVNVTQVIEAPVLPSHLVGSLLDVLA